MRTGIDLIKSERNRQLKKRSRAHDKKHDDRSLVKAATALLLLETDIPFPEGVVLFRHKSGGSMGVNPVDLGKTLWPWELDIFQKDVNRPDTLATKLKRLQKAGALIAAEIDRLVL